MRSSRSARKKLQSGPLQPNVDLFGPDVWLWTAAARTHFLTPSGPVLGAEIGFAGSPATNVGLSAYWSEGTDSGVAFNPLGTAGVLPITSGNGHTVIVVAKPVNQANNVAAFSQRSTGAIFVAEVMFNNTTAEAAGGVAINSASSSFVKQSVSASAGGIDGNVHCWVLANGLSTGYIYRDGLSLTLTTNERLVTGAFGSGAGVRVGGRGDTGAGLVMTDPLLLVAVIPLVISERRAALISRLLSQSLAPAFESRRVFAPTAAAGGAHAATGALTGQGATVAGTAVHIAKHATSGAIAGPGAAVVGTAARTRQHANTGAIAGPGSVVAGTAAHIAKHATSGVLAGQGSAVSGVAARTRVHATSGVLAGPGAVVAGVASSATTRPSSGALVGAGAAVAGTAARTRQHATSGAVAGPGAAISGAATLTKTHATTGVIAGPGAVLDGAAARTRVHATDGAIAGPGAVVTGDAVRSAGALTHATSGAITGQSATVAGTAARTRAHATSGDIAGLTAAVSGTAAVVRTHGTSGAIAGPGAEVVGVAARTGAAVSHATSGAIVGGGASITGAAARPSQLVNVARPSRPRPRPQPVETTDQTTVIALLMAAIEECEI